MMVGSVPVLSEDNVLEMRCEDIDGLDYGIAVFDGERALWTSITRRMSSSLISKFLIRKTLP